MLSVGLVALLSRRCGDRGQLSLELKMWQGRCLVCDEAWSLSLVVRNPGNSAASRGFWVVKEPRTWASLYRA